MPTASQPSLCFTSAVDRALIHRHHASEAFLADVVSTGLHSFSAAAVLPAAHPHYGGHTGPSRDLDPMLLLECARQAETYAAHVLFGVGPGDRFVLHSWSACFPAELPAVRNRTELTLNARTTEGRRLGGRLHGLTYEMSLWADRREIGQLRMTVRYVSPATYTALRARHRIGPPPASDRLRQPGGRLADPAAVGRIRATDVVLLDVATGPRSCTARLRVPAENPSLFDHVQDHVPAMVLTEAARQMAVLATRAWGGEGPDRTRLVDVDGVFERYAELDAPIEIAAEPNFSATLDRSILVTFRQSGAAVAAIRVWVAAVHRDTP